MPSSIRKCLTIFFLLQPAFIQCFCFSHHCCVGKSESDEKKLNVMRDMITNIFIARMAISFLPCRVLFHRHMFFMCEHECACVCACAILAGWLPLWPPIRKKKYTQIQRTCLIAFMWRSCKYFERLFALLFCYLLVFGSKWHSFNALQPILYVCLPKSRMLRNRQCRRKRLWLLATAFSYVSQIFFVLLTVFRIIGMIFMWATLCFFVVFRGCNFSTEWLIWQSVCKSNRSGRLVEEKEFIEVRNQYFFSESTR